MHVRIPRSTELFDLSERVHTVLGYYDLDTSNWRRIRRRLATGPTSDWQIDTGATIRDSKDAVR